MTVAEKKHIEVALSDCAERGVPDAELPWTRIRDRALAGSNPEHYPSQRFRLVPRTRSGLFFAALLTMVFGTVSFAATNVAYDMFREAVPGGNSPDFGEEIGQTRTVDGAKVTLEWAYADTEFVVVGYSVEDLTKDRRTAGYPAELTPLWVSDERRFARDNPGGTSRLSDLTDQNGREFAHIDGMSMAVEPGSSPEEIRAPKATTAVFEAPQGFGASPKHRFDFEVFLEVTPVPSSQKDAQDGTKLEKEPLIGPLAFDFEVPVKRVPVVEVGQKRTVEGIALTLERVINSPGRPQAMICVEQPEGEHENWQPTMKNQGYSSDWPPAPQPLKGNCWSATLGDPVEGRSSVTVKNIWGTIPTSKADKGEKTWREIQGPWTFEFEAPER